MGNLYRFRVGLDGFIGAPGVATFYGLDNATMVTSLRTFWGSVAGYLPMDVGVHVHSFGDIIEDTTGAITGAWDNHAVDTTQQGTGGPTYAAPVGASIQWNTSTILDGKRIRGRTFVVPMISAAYNASGQILDAYVTGLLGAAQTLQTEQSASLVVWHRPFAGKPAVGVAGSPGYRAARPAHLGGHALITGAGVSHKAAVLRSRRD